jgi:protein SCO1/2
MSLPSSEAPARAAPALLARVVFSPLFWVALLGAMIAMPVMRQLRPARTAPPVLGTLSPFTLTSQSGAPFGAEDLRGKAWVANFIFTRCPTVCPPFTRKMAALQDRTRPLQGVHLVSFSVDPGYDTPEVLTEYARTHGADPARWTFLTGEEADLRATVIGGLKVMLGRNGPADDLNSIFHGTHFVLVDGAMNIRGYYASDDPEALERLWKDLVAL